MPAPVAIICFDRDSHLETTLKALANNSMASDTNVFVFQDGLSSTCNQQKHQNIANLVKGFQGFSEVHFIQRQENLGLSNNITKSVAEVLESHDRVIVLEDDIKTSAQFLSYMNQALDYYKDDERVMNINGYMYPISSSENLDFFFSYLPISWGWATWKRAWDFYEKNVDDLLEHADEEFIKGFNFDGVSDFWLQVVQNKTGEKDTWAIFWYATLFRKKCFSLNPSISFVQNTGNDGTGTHSLDEEIYQHRRICEVDKYNFSSIRVMEDKVYKGLMIDFFISLNPPFLVKALNRIKKIFRKILS